MRFTQTSTRGTPLLLTLLLLLLAAVPAWPVEIRNTASGTVQGAPLDDATAQVSLNRLGAMVQSATAEIWPNQTLANRQGRSFVYDVLAQIDPADTGIDQVTIDAPPGYSNLAVQGVQVGGATRVENCPSPGPGQFCVTRTGKCRPPRRPHGARFDRAVAAAHQQRVRGA